MAIARTIVALISFGFLSACDTAQPNDLNSVCQRVIRSQAEAHPQVRPGSFELIRVSEFSKQLTRAEVLARVLEGKSKEFTAVSKTKMDQFDAGEIKPMDYERYFEFSVLGKDKQSHKVNAACYWSNVKDDTTFVDPKSVATFLYPNKDEKRKKELNAPPPPLW